MLVHNGAELYGGSKSLLSIVNVLNDEMHELIVILPISGDLVVELEKINIKVIIVKSIPSISKQSLNTFVNKLKFVKNFFISIKDLILITKKLKPEIIHINVSTLPSVALAARLSKIKVLSHIREIYDGNQKYLWFFYQLYIYVMSNKIIVNSTATKEQFFRFCLKKISILHNSFPITPLKNFPQSYEIKKFKKMNQIQPGFCVGMVGRINLNRKGQDVFAKSALIVIKKFPNVKFLIFGSPYPGKNYHKENLKKIIEKYNLSENVLLLGEVRNIILAYAVMDIVVIPSVRPESFGNVALEAMNLKKPIISSNIGGMLDQIVEGKNGYFYEKNNYNILGKKITSLLSNKQKRLNLGQNGRVILEKKFNYITFSNKLKKIYTFN